MTRSSKRCRRHGGFTLIEVAIVGALLALAAVAAGRVFLQGTLDAKAQATGAYLLTMRGAVLQSITTHYDLLHRVDTSAAPAGTYPTPNAAMTALANNLRAATHPDPTFRSTWRSADPATLRALAFLPPSLPDRPPLGGAVVVKIKPFGTCPGPDCNLTVLIHTCLPVGEDSGVHLPAAADCSAYDTASYQGSPDLVGQVMLSTQGFGINNWMAPNQLRGPLFNQAGVAWSAGAVGQPQGLVGVVASLDATSLSQFVRHGDTRRVRLNNTLDVAGNLTTDTALTIRRAAVAGSACTLADAYGTTQLGVLAQCVGNRWQELTRHVVAWHGSDLAQGAVIPAPACAPGTVPWVRIAQQTVATTATGSEVTVRGTLAGNVTGSGSVNTTGSVSVTGTVRGTVSSTADSSVRTRQSVTATPRSSGWTVAFSVADAAARASAMTGCTLG
ncbi:prepilin-type N-terminal cleavage/methylation domain-containing protein [Achromobacter sp. GG226]|uniref:prepilin-type N-terminal cleavage/methylation domain-containing protein n=1 Tax=Verticiella alkaliphila TaxID=2779529 RepID=UPI001C0C3081|nr:prepilin-type N-terminal cleavage/methylation domain-containing protein [Verticiella sp. GG226]MBU4610292.1 prepilin-type N-terminal cleavage/methylation domain-containing protein [Verticiella sp. GG226]